MVPWVRIPPMHLLLTNQKKVPAMTDHKDVTKAMQATIEGGASENESQPENIEHRTPTQLWNRRERLKKTITDAENEMATITEELRRRLD